jgi:hypothetical protein
MWHRNIIKRGDNHFSALIHFQLNYSLNQQTSFLFSPHPDSFSYNRMAAVADLGDVSRVGIHVNRHILHLRPFGRITIKIIFI